MFTGIQMSTNNSIQKMHSTEVNIRICQPEKVMFTVLLNDICLLSGSTDKSDFDRSLYLTGVICLYDYF